jgi:hypothetical protein
MRQIGVSLKQRNWVSNNETHPQVTLNKPDSSYMIDVCVNDKKL